MTYIYGRNAVIEALKAKKVDKLYALKNLSGSANKIFAMAREEKIVLTECDKKKIFEMVGDVNHQGIVALVSQFDYTDLDEMIEEAKAKDQTIRLIILDEIEDPYNFGAIARSVEAAGFTGIIIPKRRSALVNDAVYKSSAGAIERVKVSRVVNLSQTIEKLKEKGVWVYGADMEGESIYESDLRGNICLVIGNEGKGLGHSVEKNCDQIISIPMKGNINSLNASCAAAIMIFEVMRQAK